MMMVIVDGELMDVIEMMVDKQADLVVNLEADKVTKEKWKVDQEQDEGSETVAMMMILIVDGVVMDIIEMMVDKQADLRLPAHIALLEHSLIKIKTIPCLSV